MITFPVETPVGKIAVANICTAFDETGVIGTKVTRFRQLPFLDLLVAAIQKHDWKSGAVPGQAVLPLNEATSSTGSSSSRSSG